MQQDKRLRALEYERVPKLLFRYSLPAVVGTMVNALYNIIDRIFIGQGVGDDAIAGLAITFPVLLFAQAFGMLVGVGASVRIAILLGQKDREKAEKVLGNSIYLTFFFNLLVAVFGYIFMDPLLELFGATPRIMPYAKNYLSLTLGFNVFADLAFSYNAIIRTTGYPLKAMLTMMIGAVMNCLLDPLFIFVFKWGIAGAAWATNISMVVTALFVMSHFFDRRSVLHFRREAFVFSFPIMRTVLAVGVSPFAMMLVNSFINVVINRSFNHYGSSEAEIVSAIAAYGIIMGISQLFVQFMVGVSQGGQPIISYNLGAGHTSRSINTYKLSLLVNVSVALIGFFIANFFPEVFVRPFKPGEDLLKLTNLAIGIVFLGYPFVGIQVTTVQFFQSLGFAVQAMFITLTRQVIYLIPGLFLIPLIGGLRLKGIWIAMPIADILSGLTSLIMVLSFLPKIRRRYRDIPVKDLKTLPEEGSSPLS